MTQKNQLIVIIFLSTSFLISQCEGFNWHDEFNILDCNQNDIKILNQFINQSSNTINMDMDTDLNGKVDALELGWQMWERGRLVHWICNDVPSPWYVYPYNCGLSGSLPDNIDDLSMIQKLKIEKNMFTGEIPKSICRMNVTQSSLYWFDLSGNRFEEPFPDCIKIGK
jgi:hypothetical protein